MLHDRKESQNKNINTISPSLSFDEARRGDSADKLYAKYQSKEVVDNFGSDRKLSKSVVELNRKLNFDLDKYQTITNPI